MISRNMKLAIYCILSAFCVFHVKSNSITEFKAVVDEAVQQILDYEEQFHNSMIVLLSNLKDTSTVTLGESWNATFVLIDVLNEKLETKEKKDCITSERNKLREVIIPVAFALDECVQNGLAIGQPIRKKIQDAHEASMNIQKELDATRNTCSVETAKPEAECISLKLDDLKTSLKSILDQVQTYKIEAGTIKPKILSDAMLCNVKVLTEVHEAVTNIQENLRKCVL